MADKARLPVRRTDGSTRRSEPVENTKQPAGPGEMCSGLASELVSGVRNENSASILLARQMVEVIGALDGLPWRQVAQQHDVCSLQRNEQRALRGPRPDNQPTRAVRRDRLCRGFAGRGKPCLPPEPSQRVVPV
jgi:hypothetical protein